MKVLQAKISPKTKVREVVFQGSSPKNHIDRGLDTSFCRETSICKFYKWIYKSKYLWEFGSRLTENLSVSVQVDSIWYTAGKAESFVQESERGDQ